MKALILFILLIILQLGASFGIQAQSLDIRNSHPKLMVIPCQSGTYVSDIDLSSRRYIRNPRFTPHYNANDLLRGSLEKSLFESLLLYFDINRIGFYQSRQAIQDLDLIYGSIGYITHKEHLKAIYKNIPGFTIFQIFDTGKKRWGVNCMNEENLIPVIKNPVLYYNEVIIKNPSLLPYLGTRYNCDYYLFVNGIELKTRFKVCMDLLHNVQQKDIILHFSLIDRNGSKITGGLVGLTYEPTSYNDIYEIIENNVGILSDLVVNVIRDELKLTLRYEL